MKLVVGEPAAVSGKTLLIADVHLGVELELREQGLRFSPQHLKEACRVKALMSRTRTKRLVIVGDAKHDVRGFETQERRMAQEFVDAIGCDVTVVKGNHDSMLSGVKGLAVEPSDGIVFDGIGLVHGHAWPCAEVLARKTILCGHQHPVYAFHDSLGKWQVPCWLKARLGKSKLLVLPAFGRLAGGTRINKEKLLGPLFAPGKASDRKAFTLYGEALGKV